MVAYDGNELDDLREPVEHDEHPDHDQYAALHRFLDECEADGLRLPFDGLGIQAGWEHTEDRQGRTGIARVLRVARRAGLRVAKRAPIGDSRSYDLHVPGRPDWDRLIHVYAGAEYTCERVQVGTKTVERTEVIRPAETRLVTVEEPVYEWRCGPVLAPDSPDADADADTDPELVADPVADAEDRGSQADPDRYDDERRPLHVDGDGNVWSREHVGLADDAERARAGQ